VARKKDAPDESTKEGEKGYYVVAQMGFRSGPEAWCYIRRMGFSGVFNGAKKIAGRA
jgi:hypothetical protein